MQHRIRSATGLKQTSVLSFRRAPACEVTMLDDPDYELDKTASETLSEERRSSRRPGVVALVRSGCGGVGGYLFVSRRPAPESQPAQVAERRRAPSPSAAIALAVDVPALDASDALVRELVRQLSAHPLVAAWLARDGLIRNFTVVVSNIAEGATPGEASRAAPAEPLAFRSSNAATALYLDPQSYERYTALAGAFASVNATDAARLYATLKPRIEEANSELGAAAWVVRRDARAGDCALAADAGSDHARSASSRPAASVMVSRTIASKR